MNEVPDSILNSLRNRIIRTIGSEDYAQDACIELLTMDISQKPIDHLVSNLVRKYKNRWFRKMKTRREIPVSEILKNSPGANSEDFLDSLVDWQQRKGIDIKEHIPASLRKAIEFLELGFSLEEAARQCGITYDALRWRFHYYIKKILRTSQT